MVRLLRPQQLKGAPVPTLDLADPPAKWLPDVQTDQQLADLVAIVQRRIAADNARLQFLLAVQGIRQANTPPPPTPTTA
jgi:hypothetical protein